jgi:hypothetical protein
MLSKFCRFSGGSIAKEDFSHSLCSLASPNFLSIYAYDKSRMPPSRIRLIIKYIDRLRDFQSVKLIDYRENFGYQLMVERFLQLLVKASSDINSYLLLQLHDVTPSTYYESFIEAGKNHLITRELANGLAKLA